MPRKRKGDPRTISSETEMREGVSLVVEQNYTLRHAAESTGLKYQTLARYVNYLSRYQQMIILHDQVLKNII